MMAPKNIALVHETSCFSGAEESLLNLSRFLDPARFRPVFILPESGAFSRKLIADGTPVFFAAMPRIRDWKGVAAAAVKIRDLAAKNDSALIHTNSIRSHLYGAYAAKMLKLPLVWHERCLLTSEKIDFDRALSCLPDAIICNSHAIARRFLVKGGMPDKVRVIHNGVDLSRFKPSLDTMAVRREFGIAAGEVVIGTASRFNPDKGLRTFLAAARSLLDALPESARPVRCLIAGGAVFSGDMAEEAALRRVACELGIAERVVFTGFREDMASVFAAMDIFVLAADAEGCGRVLFESMASGKPVVATGTGGTPEVVVDGVTGILVKPRDPSGLARVLGELVGDERKRITMGLAARRHMEERFPIRQNVEKTEDVYAALLARRRR